MVKSSSLAAWTPRCTGMRSLFLSPIWCNLLMPMMHTCAPESATTSCLADDAGGGGISNSSYATRSVDTCRDRVGCGSASATRHPRPGPLKVYRSGRLTATLLRFCTNRDIWGRLWITPTTWNKACSGVLAALFLSQQSLHFFNSLGRPLTMVTLGMARAQSVHFILMVWSPCGGFLDFL